MPGPKPGARPRMGGGFNQLSGEIGDEHMQSNAMQQAMQQKSASQQNANPQQGGQTSSAKQQQQAQGQPQPPREVGTISDEFKRMGGDMIAQLRDFFSINNWLGINPETDDPEEVAKRKAVHQRWQKLDDEQQQLAKKMYQEDLERKKQEQEEEQRKKELAEQQQAQDLPMPSSPKKGPAGPGGSKKQQTQQKLQSDRQKMSGPSSAN